MAVTHETLRLSHDLRIIISGIVNDSVRGLVKAWATAWDEIEHEFTAAIGDLLAVTPGEWPTRRQVARAERASRALEHAIAQLDGLTEFSGVLISRSGSDAVLRAVDWQDQLIRSQLPPSAPADVATVMASFNRLDAGAVDAIIERVTGQVTSTLRPLTGDAVNAMRRSLIRGVVVGDNPRRAAADMLARVRGDFNGGLTRALTIARTEILDAYRSSAAATHLANADLLQGWMWLAQLDSRTCPSCWAMHGSEHDLTELGPNDHQNGRCARLPVTKSWKDLGFDGIDEPPSVVPDAQAVFAQLPRSEQLTVMGPARLAALDNGAPWSSLTMRRTTTGWRDSHVPAPASRVARASFHAV